MIERNLTVFPISLTVFEELYTVMAGQKMCIVPLILRATTRETVQNKCFMAAFCPLVSSPDLATSHMPTKREHIVTHY